MASIIVDLSDDIKKMQSLREEIQQVKKELGSINVKVELDIKRDMEARLKSLTDQYDALVQKVAQADAKIAESTARINKSAEAVIKAQEQMEKAASGQSGSSVQGASSRNTASSNAQTASVEAQAKAYDELADEINKVIGTKEQNIRKLAEEQNAVRLINKELKELTPKQDYGLPSVQKRIEELNASLIEHKTQISNIRQILNNEEKLYQATAGSMQRLSQELGRMRIAYRNMSDEAKASPFGQELLASIEQADAKIKQLDASIGNHQRNVGNYASGWNGLNMSIQQIGRELPSLAMGWNTFFLAISNNLPILTDEIKRAKDEYNNLKKAGQDATPVWKQVVSSLISWQTALTVGITLLTMYGKEIMNWVSGLFSAKKALSDTFEATEEFQKNVSNSIGNVLSTFESLSSQWKELGNDIQAQNKFITENKDKFDMLGISITNVSEAEKLLSANKGRFVEALIAKAKAVAAMNIAAKQYEEAIQKMMKAETTQTNFGDRIQAFFAKSGLIQLGDYESAQKITAQQFTKDRKTDYETQAQELIKDAGKIVKKYAEYSDEERKILEEIGLKSTDQIVSNSVEAINATIALKREALNKVTNRKDYARIEAEIKAEQAKLDAITGGGNDNKTKQSNLIKEQQDKINELLDKQAKDRIKQQIDLENQVAQARIDAMADGAEKERAQRELDNKKELQAIEQQKQEYIQKTIQAQKEIFDEQEKLRAKQNPSYKIKSFDSSSVSVDTSMFDELRKLTQKRQTDDELKVQEDAWNEYLIKFGDYQQKRQAIIEKYNKQIEKAQTAGEAAILYKERQNALDELDSSIKDSATLMGQLFADASQKSVSEIQKIIDKAELLMDYLGSVKDSQGTATIDGEQVTRKQILNLGISENSLENLELSADKVDALRRGIESLKGELGSRSPFKLLETQIEDAVKKIRSGGKDNIAQGIQGIGNAISSFAPSLSQFGQDLGTIFGDDKLGEDIATVSDAIGGLGQAAMGVGQIMSGDVVGGIMSVVGGAAKAVEAIGKLFGPDGTAYYEKVKEQLETINGTYQKIIDSSKELIQFGGGFASIDAASLALDNYYKKVQNLQRISEASMRYGASWKSHSAGWHSNKNVGAENFAEMSGIVGKTINDIEDLTSLTGDELYLIMSQMPEAWSKIDEHIRTALEDIIECKDEADELKEALNEAVTGISFDSFYNGFIDKLSDMEISAEDFADNFEEYLRKSILASIISNQYKGQIEKLYNDWAKAGEDQNFTEEEVNALRQSQQELINSLIQERENLGKTFGWDTESSKEQQSATSKGFETMTQDQASELSGRFTAVAESNYRIENATNQQTLAITQLSGSISVLTSQIYGSQSIADDTRNILAQSYLELQQINENTGNSAKYLKDIKADIAIVKQNTSRL